MKPNCYSMPKITLLFLLLLGQFIAVPSFAQVEDILNDDDYQEDQLDAYNNGKEDLEQLIKRRECVEDLKELKQAFINEIQFIDSLCGIGETAKIPEFTKSNKLMIVAKPKEGRTCILIRYEEMKFLPGCEEPFFSASIDWTQFKNIQAAKKEGKLCLVSVQSSGYTQVEKIPSAQLTKKSADMLLKKINRVLTAYPDKIGVTFEQYKAYESKKNLSELKDIIILRTSFLNKCRNKIQ